MHQQHVLIAGAGHAGGRVAQSLREAGYTGMLTLIGDEPYLPYERPALSKEVLQGKKSFVELTLEPTTFWEDKERVQWLHAGITSISKERVATLSNGDAVDFDMLVVATGGSPRTLLIPGGDLPGIYVLRTIDDCRALRPVLSPGGRLVVIGGGVIGMEAAASATTMGVNVTVIEAGTRIMARCLPPEASDWLQAVHQKQGVDIKTGTVVDSIERHHDELLINIHQAGKCVDTLSADVVLVAIGIVPNTDFLEGSGIAVDNGVQVDASCRSTNTEWCFAVGDVANTFNPHYQSYVRQETWRNAENQARAVAETVMGRGVPYREVPWMWSDQFDRNIQVVGIYSPSDVTIMRKAFGESSGSMLWLRDGRVAGGVLLDSGRERKSLEALVRRGSQMDAQTLSNTSMSLKELATT